MSWAVAVPRCPRVGAPPSLGSPPCLAVMQATPGSVTESRRNARFDRFPLPHRLVDRGVPRARARAVPRQHDAAEHRHPQPAQPGQAGHRQTTTSSRPTTTSSAAQLNAEKQLHRGGRAVRRRGSAGRRHDRGDLRARRGQRHAQGPRARPWRSPAGPSLPTCSCSRRSSTPPRTPSSVRLASEIVLPGHTLPARQRRNAAQLGPRERAGDPPGSARAPRRGKVTQALSAMADGKFISISGDAAHPSG